MLAIVTRFCAMVRFGSSFIDLTGEERVNPDLRGRGLCCKWPGEAREAKFWPLGARKRQAWRGWLLPWFGSLGLG